MEVQSWSQIITTTWVISTRAIVSFGLPTPFRSPLTRALPAVTRPTSTPLASLYCLCSLQMTSNHATAPQRFSVTSLAPTSGSTETLYQKPCPTPTLPQPSFATNSPRNASSAIVLSLLLMIMLVLALALQLVLLLPTVTPTESCIPVSQLPLTVSLVPPQPLV